MSEVVKKPPDTLTNTLDEVRARVSVAIHKNRHRDTLRRQGIPQILSEVLKSVARLLKQSTDRNRDLDEIVDCVAYLVIAFHRRKQPYGER